MQEDEETQSAFVDREDRLISFHRHEFKFDARFLKDIFRVCQQFLFPEELGHGGHLHCTISLAVRSQGDGLSAAFKYILNVLIVVSI